MLGNSAIAEAPLASQAGAAAEYSRCYASIRVLSRIELASTRAACFTRIEVEALGTAACAVEIEVRQPQGIATVHTSISVRAYGAAQCHTGIAVTDGGMQWKPRVILGGNDVTSRLTGRLSVEAEEGAARIAEFFLVPEDGSINIFSLSGATVVIDYVTIESGADVAQRLFTGRVDIPEYDPGERLLKFSCTDDLQNRVANMTRAQIDALCGGRYAEAVQGETDDNWEYAQAQMRTVSGSLDAGAHGGMRVTPWHGIATFRTFTLDDTLDKEIHLDLPRRTHLVNRVDCIFEYRHARLRQRYFGMSFRADLDTVIDRGLPLLAQETVASALKATGWDVVDARYWEFPALRPLPGGGYWFNRSDLTCMEARATLRQRWAQTITEEYSITVTAPQSISANGTIARTERGSLQSEWDAQAWEDNSTTDPVLTGTASQDHAPDITTAERDTALQALVDVARVTILGSHRSGRVSATIPAMPSLDLVHACRINTPTVQATGKVVRVMHIMDMDDGSALTEFSIAVSGHGAVGIEVTDTPVVAPDAPAGTETTAPDFAYLYLHVGAQADSEDYSDTMQGWIVNAPRAFNVTDQGGSSYTYDAETQKEQQQDYSGTVSNSSYIEAKAYPSEGFRLILPAVEDDQREPATIPGGSEYQVDIPEDEFLLAA